MAAHTDSSDRTPAYEDPAAGADAGKKTANAASGHADGAIPATRKGPANTGTSANLESVLRRIVEHIESTDRRHSEVLTDLRERILALGQQTQAARQGSTNLSSDELNKLEHQVKHLSECVANAELARSEGETRQQLEKRISGLNDDSFQKTNVGAEAGTGTAPDVGGQISIAELARDLNADITFTVTGGSEADSEDPSGRGESAQSTAAEQNVIPDETEADEEIASALVHIYDAGPGTSKDEQEPGESPSASDPATPNQMETVPAENETASSCGKTIVKKSTPPPGPASISLNIVPARPADATGRQSEDARKRKAAQDERFAQVAVALEDTMQQKKAARRERDAVRACFDDLSARVEAMLRSRVKEFSLEPIERQVAEISAYIARTEEHFGKINTIETKLLQLIELVENTQLNIAATTSEALETAARRIEKTIAKSTPAERLEVIQKSIESLAEKGRTTEVQTVDTLETINDTLTNMVDRLQSVEKTGIATKAELKAIRQAYGAMGPRGGESTTDAPADRNGAELRLRNEPANIAAQVTAASEPYMPPKDAGVATAPERSESGGQVARGAEIRDSAYLSETLARPGAQERTPTGCASESPHSVFPSGGMSRKEDFISAARRAALQESADLDQGVHDLEDEAGPDLSAERPQSPVLRIKDTTDRLKSFVRSLPRPPFVMLAIAAFTAGAAILVTDHHLAIVSADREAWMGRNTASKAAAITVNGRNVTANGGENREISHPPAIDPTAKAVRVIRAPDGLAAAKSDRMAARSLSGLRGKEEVSNEVRNIAGPLQPPGMKDAETKTAAPVGPKGPTAKNADGNKAGPGEVKSTSAIIVSAHRNNANSAALRPRAITPGANPASPTETNKRGQKPAARPTEKPALSLPPTTIGSLALRRAAANGNSAAQFQIALRYVKGENIRQDYAKAAVWFKRAASRGFAPAEYRIATLHERGLGLTKDLGRAQLWYRRAADHGNVKAMHNLAVLYTKGAIGAPDYVRAAEWFHNAAAYGLADSLFNLGVLYETGLGVNKDLAESYKWFSLAAADGDEEAQRKRASLQIQLPDESRKLANLAARKWRAKSIDAAANMVLVPIDGWESAPAKINLLSAKEVPNRFVTNKS